jgi:PHS family inorganic phosphate transporter-like MFS transporter
MAQSAQALEIPKASFKDFLHHYGQWKNGKILLGTAGSWFFLEYVLSWPSLITLLTVF